MNSDAILEANHLIADAIDGAEEVSDPLSGLAEKAADDPGAPFMPEALEALSALKRDNRAAFEALRSQLKKAGCRVTALDDAIAEENGDQGGRGPTQADILIGLAQAAELFHAADGSGFADLDTNGHRETWRARRRGAAGRHAVRRGGQDAAERTPDGGVQPPHHRSPAQFRIQALCLDWHQPAVLREGHADQGHLVL
jgi:hypothetical protein